MPVRKVGRVSLRINPNPCSNRLCLVLSSHNPFVEIAVQTVVIYLSANTALLPRHNKGCLLTVLADNDFYSQSVISPARWQKIGGKIKDAPKTGLGSSAAMTSSLIAALSTFLSPEQRPLARDVLHNMAQFAHSYAQGKIGSGFDVSGVCICR